MCGGAEKDPDIGLLVKEGQGTRAQMSLLWSSLWDVKNGVELESLDAQEEEGETLLH